MPDSSWFGTETAFQALAVLRESPARVVELLNVPFRVVRPWRHLGPIGVEGRPVLTAWTVGSEGVTCALLFDTFDGWQIKLESPAYGLCADERWPEVPIPEFLRHTMPLGADATAASGGRSAAKPDTCPSGGSRPALSRLTAFHDLLNGAAPADGAPASNTAPANDRPRSSDPPNLLAVLVTPPLSPMGGTFAINQPVFFLPGGGQYDQRDSCFIHYTKFRKNSGATHDSATDRFTTTGIQHLAWCCHRPIEHAYSLRILLGFRPRSGKTGLSFSENPDDLYNRPQTSVAEELPQTFNAMGDQKLANRNKNYYYLSRLAQASAGIRPACGAFIYGMDMNSAHAGRWQSWRNGKIRCP